MSEAMFTREMSTTTDHRKLEMTKTPYLQVTGNLMVTGSRVDIGLLSRAVLSTESIWG